MKRPAALFAAVLALALAAGLARSPAPATAQRPTPGPGGGPSTELLKRYGTRLALPLPGAGGAAAAAASTVLEVTNVGWKPVGVLWVELGAGPAASCPTALTPPVTRYSCQTDLPPLALATQAVAAAGTRSVLAYSLAADHQADACAAFAAVASGSQSLTAWERGAWVPGEPLAILSTTGAGQQVTGLAAEPSVGVAGILSDRPGRPGRLAQTLPATWATAEGGQAVALNVAGECASLSIRQGLGDAQPCAPTRTFQAQVPPLALAELNLAQGPGPRGLVSQIQGEAILATSRRTAGGWWSYSGAGASNEAGGVAFPLAIGPLPDTRAELAVTNTNLTATAQVELVMFDGNQSLHKLYTDPLPLCAGGTRRYDLTALAGDIPPTSGGRGGAEGPPMLSVRVQGTSSQSQQAPMLSGVMVIANAQGVTAYGGQANSASTLVFQAIRRQQPGLAIWTVVPGVTKAYGPEGRTSVLAIQVLGNPQAENAAYVDLYDTAGQRVASEVPVRLAAGAAGFLDLGVARAGLPNGFRGTAVVRGQQNRGTLAVLALERRAGAGAGDRLLSWPGVILPRWPDPDAASPTPPPTRDPNQPTSTRAPTQGSRTPGPSATASPTIEPSPARPTAPALFFPFAERQRPSGPLLVRRGPPGGR